LQRFQDLKLTSISAPHCERRSKAVDLEICPITVTPEQAGEKEHKIYAKLPNWGWLASYLLIKNMYQG
jgi:hypothetical protein